MTTFTHSRYNLSEEESDIHIFIREYKERIRKQLEYEEESTSQFISLAEKGFRAPEDVWLHDNTQRFFRDTPNEFNYRLNYLAGLGFICSMVYSPDGGYLIVGHATGLIQMRHGVTGTVLATLRSIQFPHKPVYALEYSRTEERVCYAACSDGAVYKIDIPNIDTSLEDPPEYCIRADPALECLNTQFYGSPGMSNLASPIITQRYPALSLGLSADKARMVVGYADTSIKVYDMATQEAELTYKVHKLRLQFIPKKLQRMHSGQVCAVCCHDIAPNIFASGAWDRTLRASWETYLFCAPIWDIRCPIGCIMTFEGVNICHNSVDICRDHCISGSWQPTEAVSLWDLVAKKRVSVIRVQNRRPDVDGEYVYACRYWKSSDHNRKGKYGIVGGSGTNCVEVINLHNRYITCSYPAPGTVLAVASHQERIAFGGTAPVLNMVTFHDPKHEEYIPEVDFDYDYTKPNVLFEDDIAKCVNSDLALTPQQTKL